MSETSDMKKLAEDAAKNATTPTELPPEAESAANSGKATMVGGIPVVVTPPKKKTIPAPTIPNPAEALMSTPSPNSAEPPVPSAVGLDADALSTEIPKELLNTSNPAVAALNIPDYSVYNPDGSFTDDQKALIAELMPNVPEDEKNKFAREVFDGYNNQIKDAVMAGLTHAEAQQSAVNRIRKKFSEKNDAEISATRAEIVLEKGQDPNGLGLTADEHNKLERAKRVRLILVEDKELNNIVIERPNETHKADYVRSIEGSMSKYQIPLPMLGDFITVKGAQIVQLINAVNYEDSSMDEIINTKASLIYEKLMGGSILRRYDSEGKTIMSYNEFINKFAFQDIDIALYGILCASSMEETSTSLTCQTCSHVWNQPYKLQSLLKMDHIDPKYKARIEGILSNKSNDIVLREMYEAQRKAVRFRSPFSNNIYDISYPTVARAINLLKRVDQDDPTDAYISAIGLYLSSILVYNEGKGTYVPIEAEETDLMLDVLKNLPNEDMNMLANQVKSDFFYEAKFTLPVTCPSCHKFADIPISIENMVFLMAQDSMVEIEP